MATMPTIREVVGSSLLYTANSKINTVTTSTNVRAGDTMLIIYGLDYGQLDQSQGPTPGGWMSQGVAAAGTQAAPAAPYTRAWTSQVLKDGAQTVSITQTDQYTDSNFVLIVLTGADPKTPVDVVAVGSGSAAGTASTPATHNAPAVTPTYPNELIITACGCGTANGDTGNYTAPAGTTKTTEVDSAPYSTLGVASMPGPAGGVSTGVLAWKFTRSTSPTTSVPYAALTLAIKPASTPSTQPVSSGAGVASSAAASKSVTVNVTSTVGVGTTPAPSKRQDVAVASPIGLTSLAGARQDVVSIQPGGPLDISLWALDDAGNYIAPLPDYQKVTLSPVVNAPGAISIDYPVAGLNFHFLHDIILANRDLPIAVQLGGRNAGSMRGLILEASGDEVKEQEVWTFTGAFDEYRMSDAVIYPDPSDPSGQQELVVTAATAGQIMAKLMAQAQARGTLLGITWDSFTAVTDSNGTPWSTVGTMAVSPGADYASFLGTLYSIGLCEWEIATGPGGTKSLRLYEPFTRGVDRTKLNPPCVLRASRDITEAPRKFSIRDSGTSMVGVGANGLNATTSDPTGLARRGRRIEKYASQNQVTDQGSLIAFMQAQLGSQAHGKMELTHGLSFVGGPVPIGDFRLGDWVWSDNGNGYERLRVQQWTISQDQNGRMTGSATVGTLIDEAELQLAQRLAAITSGTTVVGTSPSSPTPTNNDKVPATPTGLVVSTLFYVDPGPPAADAAAVYCGWAPVTTNADGTTITSAQISYRVRYRYLDDTSKTPGPLPEGWQGTPADGLPWIAAGSSTSTTLQFSGIAPNRPIEVEVAAAIALDPNSQPFEFDSLNRAFRRTSLQSAWSPGVDVTTAADTTPPLAPSAPVASTGPGAIARIVWDGTSFDGNPLAQECPDLARVEVHVSAVSNFTPDATTFRDTLYGPGAAVISSGLLYQVGYFARLVAVDQAGNRSLASDQVVFTPHELLGQDLFAGCVGSAQLADLAVTNAKIAQLAVNDAQIANLSVGKLTSGVGTFDLLLAGRIRTGDTGARIEMDNTSFRQYGVDGATLMTQFVAATGEALITGLIRSAMQGKRWELNPDGTLRLYPSAGTGYAAIFNNALASGLNEIVLRGQLDSQNRSGYLRVNSTGIAAQFGVPGQSVTATLTVQSGNIDMTSPLNGMRVDQRYPTSGGQPYNNLLIFNDSAAKDIATSVLQHSLWSSKATGWGCTGRNINLLFDNGTYSTNRGVLVYNDGNYADLQCGNVYAPNVTSPSGRAFKEKITDLSSSPLDVIRRAPAREWQYRKDAFEPNRSDDHGKPMLLRQRRPGTDRLTGHHHDFEYVETERPTTPHALSYTGRRRVGPIADDIEKHAPHMVHRDHNQQLHLSLNDLVGTLWAAVEHLADKVDELTDKHADITELPGRVSGRRKG